MAQKDIFIFGATHVGLRLARRLVKEGFSPLVLDELPSPPEPAQGWSYQCLDFSELPPLKEARLVYIVTDEDKINIRLALAVRSAHPDLEMVISLTQSRLGKKLSRHLSHFSFVSPPELAAKRFVNAINLPMPSGSSSPSNLEATAEPQVRQPWRLDPLVVRAIFFFAFLALFTTIYFHEAENLSWIDSWYFVITMMTTVGFGDISLRNATTLSKVIGTLLMIASVTNTAILFALITDSLLRRRLALSVGRRRIKQAEHVIVVGLGSVGMQVVQELLLRGESVTVIESDIRGRFMPAVFSLRLPVVIGDGKLERTLSDAGLPTAKALIAATNDDLTNLEVGLSAKLLSPNARVILRIYDHQLAQALDERLEIHFAFSASAIAAEELASFATATKASSETTASLETRVEGAHLN